MRIKPTHIFLFLTVIFCSSSCSSENPDVQSEIASEISVETPPVSDSYVFGENEHIHWNAEIQEDLIVLKVLLAPGWMTYSQYNENLMGPLPTLISFEPSDDYELIGSVEESLVKMKFDEEAQEELAYFEKSGVFIQKIKVISGEKFVVRGNVNFMTCDAKGCEPPTDYSFELEVTP